MILNNPFESYTVVDVETPNSQNNSICSIAVVHVVKREVIFCREYLVNPMACFDNINIDIHHITPKMVGAAPTFNLVWEEVSEFFTNGVLLAHNARFDLSVIAKTLTDNDIPVPDMSYICTMEKAKRHIAREDCCGYGLASLCSRFGIGLQDHHNALCDTNACQALFEKLIELYDIDDRDIKLYRFEPTATVHSAKPSTLQKSMNMLYGILWGIGCDQIITQKENAALYEWMDENKSYKKDEKFNDCYRVLETVLEDGILTKTEYENLLRLIGMQATSACYTDATLAMQVLMGIVKGIVSDHVINAKEADALYRWMQNHDSLKGNYPFDKIFEVLTQSLADGIIDNEEEARLQGIFRQFLTPTQSTSCSLILSGKTCCLTGNFNIGSKSDVEKHIANCGGTCIPTVTKEIDYLIVGGQGSEAWVYGNYGTKVKKALQMQEKGHKIQIIGEEIIIKSAGGGELMMEKKVSNESGHGNIQSS